MMRILHFGPPGGEEHFFSLLKGFKNLGHEVETCNIIRCSELEKVAGEAISNFKPDFIVTIGGWHAHYDAPLLWSIIKKHSIPNVYWAIEDPTFFDWVSEIHVKSYDFVFTVSEECIPKYDAYRVPSAYLPYAINPDFHKRMEKDERFKNDIVVMANKVKEYDPVRCAFRNKCYKDIVEPILMGNYDVKLYGNGWDAPELGLPEEKLGGYISARDVMKAYSSAKMTLAVQWDYTGHICFRTFEALACGCFLISPYTPVQAKTFIHGHHILYSGSPEETRKHVDYYLANDAERERIARQGQEEAYKNHNCTLRADTAIHMLKQHNII